MFNYDRMNELVKKSGKTKIFLCSQIGKGKTYLRDAEKQNTNISGNTLALLASELNTTPEYLTGETDDPSIKKFQPTGSGELELVASEVLDFLYTANDDDIQDVKDFLRMLKRRKSNTEGGIDRG